jgi:hypothetical protein
MDAFDFTEDESTKPKRDFGPLIWRLGTIYFIVSTVCICVFFVYTFINPYNQFNPFKPDNGTAQQKTEAPVPTITNTPQAVMPTLTATVTMISIPSVTPTQGSTDTFIPYPTATDVIIGGVTITPADTGRPFFIAQEGTPAPIAYPGGCDGMYVAGNVIDAAGNPLVHMIIRVDGTINGVPISVEDALSGSAPQYTESGYEIKLADAPVATTGTIYVELYSLEYADPVSDVIVFDTFDDCSKNLIIINFVQEVEE